MLVTLFICQFFFLSHKNSSQISHLLLEPVFKFCITPWQWWSLLLRENQDDEIFFFFAHLSHAILWENYIYKIMVQHTCDSYGRGYVSFAHYLLYFHGEIRKLLILLVETKTEQKNPLCLELCFFFFSFFQTNVGENELENARRIDHISHFILRLAYCRS